MFGIIGNATAPQKEQVCMTGSLIARTKEKVGIPLLSIFRK
jgi:hypothetical protein